MKAKKKKKKKKKKIRESYLSNKKYLFKPYLSNKINLPSKTPSLTVTA